MKPWRSLWVKLLAGYLLVALVAVAVVGILANRATTQQFGVYVSQGKQIRAERLAPTLAAYYAQSGSWAGVDDWIATQGATLLQGPGRGPGAGRGTSGTANEWLIVVDGQGIVVGDSQGSLRGQQLSSDQLAQGAPIQADGQVVGTVLISANVSEFQSLEQQFLSRVNRSLFWAGLAATAVALALGLILARQLTAPLRTLTEAVQRLTKRGPAQSPLEAGSAGAPQAELARAPHRKASSQDEIGQLSEAFDEMTQSLTRQETLRRNLMADIAHELRTPLSVMQGDLEALLDGVYQPTTEAFSSLHEETVLLSRLVDDLRALALAEAGQLHLQRQPTELNDLLAGVVSSFDLQAKNQGQTLNLHPTPAPLTLNVDPQRIRQVVSNLVSNSLRHAPGPGGHVLVSAATNVGEVQVSVTDDGPGIPADELPHVFDRFWRGDRARAEGSGLGLAIARELVRAHGGSIWVESAAGQGAAFHFTLPIR